MFRLIISVTPICCSLQETMLSPTYRPVVGQSNILSPQADTFEDTSYSTDNSLYFHFSIKGLHCERYVTEPQSNVESADEKK